MAYTRAISVFAWEINTKTKQKLGVPFHLVGYQVKPGLNLNQTHHCSTIVLGCKTNVEQMKFCLNFIPIWVLLQIGYKSAQCVKFFLPFEIVTNTEITLVAYEIKTSLPLNFAKQSKTNWCSPDRSLLYLSSDPSHVVFIYLMHVFYTAHQGLGCIWCSSGLALANTG